MKLMGATGMNLSTDDLTVAWTTPVVGLVLGVVVTVLAAYIPARRAGKVSPMAALRDAGTPADGKAGWIRAVHRPAPHRRRRGRPLVVAASADKAGDGSLWLGLGVVLTLIGFVVIGPLLAGGVVRVLGAVVLRIFGPVGRLAERNALRNPRRTGATGAALMIGLALVACLSVVGSSMVASATDELDKSVGADFIVQSDSGQPIMPQAEQAAEDGAGPRARHRVQAGRAPSSPPRTARRSRRRPDRRRPDVRQRPAPRDRRRRPRRRLRQGRHVRRHATSPRSTASRSATDLTVAFKDGADGRS